MVSFYYLFDSSSPRKDQCRLWRMCFALLSGGSDTILCYFNTSLYPLNRSMIEVASTASQETVSCTEADVPGALLDEPVERQSVPALKRWLLCRGIEMPRSARKELLQ